MFQPKNVYKWAKLFKEVQKKVIDEDRSGRQARKTYRETKFTSDEEIKYTMSDGFKSQS